MPVIATPLPQRLRNTDRLELNRSSWQAAGLVAWWPLGAFPDARDMSLFGGTRASAVFTGTSIHQGSPRRARAFPNTTDKIQAQGPVLSGSTDFTLSAWVHRLESPSTACYVAGNYGTGNSGGIEWFLSSSGVWGIYLAGSVTTGSSVNSGVWYHIVATRRGGSAIDLYQDGVLNSSGTLSGSIGTSRNWTIGNGPDYTSEDMDGYIDDVRVYNRTLNANEVAAIYNETRDGGYGDLAKQPTRFHHLPVAAAVTGKGSRTAMFLGVE